MLGRCG
jgi:hypothetical protein